MKVEIGIDNEQIDVITLFNLKEAYRTAVRVGEDGDILESLNDVISFFSNQEQYEEWTKELIDFVR